VKLVDVNRDSRRDAVLFGGNGLYVSVNGVSGFAPATRLSVTQPAAKELAIADLNEDGNPDVVGVDGLGVWTFFLNAAGGLASSARAGTTAARQVTLADVNADGHQDAIFGLANQGIGVSLGTGTGTLSGLDTYGSGTLAPYVAIADFNEDGRPDVGATYLSRHLGVLLNRGNGAFDRTITAAGEDANYAETSVTGDFTDDGHADVLIARNGAAGAVVYRNEAGGRYVGLTPFGSSFIKALAAGDANADGKLDAFLLTSAGQVLVHLGDGNGTFAAATSYAAPAGATEIVSGDFTGDGKLDLIINAASASLTLLTGNGAGGFASSTIPTPLAFTSLAVTKLNGDVRDDLLAAGGTAKSLYSVTAGPTFTATDLGLAGGVTQVVAADFTGDGRPDAAARTSATSVAIYRNTGSALVAITTLPVAAAPIALAAGDFDRNGISDLAAVGNGYVAVALGRGGDFERSYHLLDGPGRTLHVTDTDRDGKPDLLMSATNGTAATTNLRLIRNVAAIDVTPPTLVSSRWQATLPPAIEFTFSEPIDAATVSAADLMLRDGHGGTYAALNSQTGGATLTFALPATLPDGTYTATVTADAITDTAGNPLAADATLTFTLLRGDLNRDNVINNDDIAPFVLGLTDAPGYVARFGVSPQLFGDLNRDGLFNNDDIAAFVARLTASRAVSPAPARDVLPDVRRVDRAATLVLEPVK
jgi:hypothetical protein